MMQQADGSRFAKWLSYAVAAIIVLIPFHAFLTVFIASFAGHYTLVRLWKEVLILALAVPVATIMWRNRNIRLVFQQSRLVRVIIAFVILQVAVGVTALLFDGLTLSALLYGLTVNTRYLLFFFICLIMARQCTWLHSHWRLMVLIPAILVVSFGLLQQFVLTPGFLEHFGYGPDTIAAYSTIDNKQSYVRLQSTLRGPNPLGAYLIIVITSLLALLYKYRHLREWRGPALVASLVVVWFSSSRSALLGIAAACAVVTLFWYRGPVKKYKRAAVVAVAAALIVPVVLVVSLRHNDAVQNYVFHSDEHSQSSRSSNNARLSYWRDGLATALHHPLGQGPGTDGPASFYSNHPHISENYYLQIAQESGWLGIGLFITILAAVGRRLWQTREHTISICLLASLVGLSIAALFWHVWTDDTVAYLWWGLAGIAIGPYMLGERRSERAETK